MSTARSSAGSKEEEQKVNEHIGRVVLNEGSIKRKHNRILVTGGCGFIGSHLIDRLMADERNVVICADNCFSGSKVNVEHWLDNPRFEFMRQDVQEPFLVEVDQIYHLACPASPVFYQNNGIRTIKTNVLGTLNMLGMAKRLKARFLISSTSEVYGDPEVHPQVEEYWGHVNPIGIRSCYDEGKRLAESLCFEYYRMHGVDIRVARIFKSANITPPSHNRTRRHWMRPLEPALTSLSLLLVRLGPSRSARMARACWRTTVAWCPTSSCRR